MKFLVDAQLPLSLSNFLRELGYNSIHTLDLPLKNLSPDFVIIKCSKEEKRILITKDNDFLESFLLKAEPEKLIIVRTGNIRNAELLTIFRTNMNKIIELLGQGNLVEITIEDIVLHV